MITSYLLIDVSSQFVPQDYLTYLFHLIRLGMGAFWLQVQNLFDSRSSKNMVAPSDSLFKAKLFQ